MNKDLPCITSLMTRRRFLRIASLAGLTLLGTGALARQSKLHHAERQQALQSPASTTTIMLNGWMLREGDI